MNVRDVKETVLILVFLVDRAHQRRRRRQDLVDEDEDGLLGAQLDTLADDIDELSDGEIGRDEVLLLVDRGDVGLLNLLADDLLSDLSATAIVSKSIDDHRGCWTYGNAIGVLLADALGLSLALLEGVLVLELRTHGGRDGGERSCR